MAEPNEMECDGTDEVLCPYCGHEHCDSGEFFTNRTSTEIECDECGKAFLCSQNIVVSYTTSKKEKNDG